MGKESGGTQKWDINSETIVHIRDSFIILPIYLFDNKSIERNQARLRD